MVENQQVVKQTASANPTIGDKLKSALGMGDTLRTATTVKDSNVGLAPTAGVAPVATGVVTDTYGESFGDKIKRKLHVGGATTATTGMATTGMASTMTTAATTVTQTAVPVVAQTATITQAVPVVAQTSAAIVTDAPIVKTIAHAPVVADVHRASSVTVEERPVITQNITKPVIEIHEKHVQRNIASAPVMQQSINPTLVQEIGRENLNFVAPIPTIQTTTFEKPAVVTNVRAAPVVAEVRHKPVIERHEQVIIHENMNQSMTEVRTQPIVQNIYEKPVIVRSQETIIESAPTLVAAPTVVAAPVIATALPTTGLARRGSDSSLSSPEDVGGVPREGLGSKIKRKLHMGHGATTGTAVRAQDPFNFDPDRKIVTQPLGTTALPTTGLASTTLPATNLGTTLPEKKGGLFHRH